MKWRLIETKNKEGAWQMAADEAIMLSRADNEVPNTLRFYTWQPSALTVGFFQDIREEINISEAKKNKIDIIRRYTGGGAVFHDQEITYSIALAEKDVSVDIAESYKQICNGVIIGLKKTGLDAIFSPINDILINNKKISGSAQTRKKGVVLQHGTILLSVDVKKMFSLLKVPDEKIKDKLIKTVEERVSSLEQELKQKPLVEEVIKALSQGFAENFKVEFSQEDLSAKEKVMAEKLKQEKYLNNSWNYWR
jgi:lipoate---protein ligase